MRYYCLMVCSLFVDLTLSLPGSFPCDRSPCACECMYMCIHLCLCVFVYVHECVCVYTHTYTHARAKRTRTHTRTHTYTYIHIYLFTRTHAHSQAQTHNPDTGTDTHNMDTHTHLATHLCKACPEFFDLALPSRVSFQDESNTKGQTRKCTRTEYRDQKRTRAHAIRSAHARMRSHLSSLISHLSSLISHATGFLVFLRMSQSMSIDKNTQTHTRTHAHTHWHTHAPTHARARARAHTHTHTLCQQAPGAPRNVPAWPRQRARLLTGVPSCPLQPLPPATRHSRLQSRPGDPKLQSCCRVAFRSNTFVAALEQHFCGSTRATLELSSERCWQHLAQRCWAKSLIHPEFLR